ncbi:30S ribosomal protein S17e [Candidatus Woesearchaeota archaeon]|nr:30S ribosomal protein S17e [Candidatus Woesearchaeota archaeon]
MGRIRPTLIKRTASQLVKQHRKEFSEEFEKNKSLVSGFADIPSKKLRNVVAGYVTHLIKRDKKEIILE